MMASYLIASQAVQTQEGWDRLLRCPMEDCHSSAVEQYGFGVHDTYACLGCGIMFYLCLQAGGAWLVTTRYGDVTAAEAAKRAVYGEFWW